MEAAGRCRRLTFANETVRRPHRCSSRDSGLVVRGSIARLICLSHQRPERERPRQSRDMDGPRDGRRLGRDACNVQLDETIGLPFEVNSAAVEGERRIGAVISHLSWLYFVLCMHLCRTPALQCRQSGDDVAMEAKDEGNAASTTMGVVATKEKGKQK